ncbi:MAG TPA: hypothetical protein VGI95_14710 [Caulobacteraceae bacterium]|jgi:hypothetical protein
MMDDDLEARVARQFPSLYLTLVSVLVGLVLSDLFSEMHARMNLWPLTIEACRTWCQVLGNTLAALAAWVTYSHLGLVKQRLPTVWDTLDAVLVLITIPSNALVGRHDAAAWFLVAASWNLLAVCAVRINLWQASREPHLAHFARIGRFSGPYNYLYVGAPAFIVMSVLSYLHMTTPLVELAAAATAPIAAIAVTILFMREWRAAVLQARDTGAPGPARN